MFKMVFENAIVMSRVVSVVSTMTEIAYTRVTFTPSKEYAAMLRYKLCKQERKLNDAVKRFGYRCIDDEYFDKVEEVIVDDLMSYVYVDQIVRPVEVDRHFQTIIKEMTLKATNY